MRHIGGHLLQSNEKVAHFSLQWSQFRANKRLGKFFVDYECPTCEWEVEPIEEEEKAAQPNCIN